jgi:hypothetical protein
MAFDGPVVCVALAAVSLPRSERRGIAMPDPSSSGAVNAGSGKKPISPARHAVGFVVLIAAIVWCWFEYSAISGYNAAVNALDTRLRDENKALPALPDAETLLGKSPDGPGSEVTEGHQTFTKKTYTWRGVVKSHTLTAYYTKEREPALHHFETEGAKYQPEPNTGAPARPTEDLVRAQTKNRGDGSQDVPAKGQAAHPSDVPAKTASEAAAKSGSGSPAKTGSEPPAKIGSEPSPKAPSAGSPGAPAKGSEPKKTPEPPK